MTIYTHDMVKTMNGSQVGEACKKLGIKTINRSNEELKRILVKESKKMHSDNRKTNYVKNTANTGNAYDERLNELQETVENLENDISNLKKLVSAQNNMLEDIYLNMLELTEKVNTPVSVKLETSSFTPKLFDISDSELERYIVGISSLTLANTKTADAYDRFVEWCKTKNLNPCTRLKFSRRVCKFHPFRVSHYHTFVPIHN